MELKLGVYGLLIGLSAGSFSENPSQTRTLAANGTTITGPVELVVGQGEGLTTQNVGDVNNDTYPDFLVGSAMFDPNNGTFTSTNAGIIYLVLGGPKGRFNGTFINLWEGGVAGKVISINGTGINATYGATQASMASGDLNNDGIQDIILGSAQSASVRIIYGSESLSNISTIDLMEQVLYCGEMGVSTNSLLGTAVTTGDFDGDGFIDLIISAPWANDFRGVVYVLYGSRTNLTGGLLDLIDKTNQTIIFGLDPQGKLGTSLAMADVNQDNKEDIIIGQERMGDYNGGAIILFGVANSRGNKIRLFEASPDQYLLVTSHIAGERAGRSVGVVDFNNDSYPDVIIGAPFAKGVNGRQDAGRAYLIFGRSDLSSTGIYNLSSHTLTQGLTFLGNSSGDRLGSAVAGVGDINGDFYPDMLIGAPSSDSVSFGKTYVVFGIPQSGTLESVLSIQEFAENSGGNVINGTGIGDLCGSSVSGGSDFNLDGIPDIIISCGRAEVSENRLGQVHLIFGPGNINSSSPTSSPVVTNTPAPTASPTNATAIEPTFSPTTNNVPANSSTSNTLLISVTAVVGAVVLMGGAVAISFFRKKRRKTSKLSRDLEIDLKTKNREGKGEPGDGSDPLVGRSVGNMSNQERSDQERSNYNDLKDGLRGYLPAVRISTETVKSVSGEQDREIAKERERILELDEKGIRSFLKDLVSKSSGPDRLRRKHINELLREGLCGRDLLELKEKDLIQLGLNIGARKRILRELAKYNKPRRMFGNVPDYDPDNVKIEHKLGEGSFAVAFLGNISSRDGKVVVKMPKEVGGTLSGDTMRELQAMAQIPPHPNILELVGIVTLQGKICLISGYCAQGSLDHLHTTINMCTDRRFAIVLRDVGNGIEHLHKTGFIHRDIACRNLLMKGDGTVVICDLGLARRLTDQLDFYQMQTSKFPWPWTAPESMLSRKFSFESDVWSLGVTLWEIITKGKTPYADSPGEKAEIQSQIAEGLVTLKIPEGASELQKEIIGSCLKFKAKDRPTVSDILARIKTVESGESKAPNPRSSAQNQEPLIPEMKDAYSSGNRVSISKTSSMYRVAESTMSSIQLNAKSIPKSSSSIRDTRADARPTPVPPRTEGETPYSSTGL